MEILTCPVCQTVGPVTLFDFRMRQAPKEQWNVRKCKTCAHAEYVARYANPARRETMKAGSRNWKSENPERHAELAREYRKRNPEKIKAQNQLNYAVRKGRIQRQPCEVCGTSDRVHAHHHVSYEPKDWLNVRWLCFECHKTEHVAGG